MSAGNHAQAVAFRSQQQGIKSIIVMPEKTPFTKISKTKAYGAEIILTGRTLDESKLTVERLINENGFSFDEIVKLFNNKKGNKLSANNMLSFDEINSQIWDINHEIFIPAAASRLVTKNHLDRMISAGLNVISCGSNVPFADKEIFFGKIGEFADKRISVIPDFIANSGMARVFAYLMNPKVEMIFDIVEIGLKLVAGGLLLYVMYGFSEGMEAWVELDRMMRW